jgi:carbonic anhydrase/acetyltransferase-like protein (isoleucine patch superfamily)
MNELIPLLRQLTERPSRWTDLRTDAPIINLDDQAARLRQQLIVLDDEIHQTGLLSARGHELDHKWEQLADLATWYTDPNKVHLATGETIHFEGPDTRRVDPWIDDNVTAVTTRRHQRYHLAGIHPFASVHPDARIDPTARVDALAWIGPDTRIGEYAHIGAGATIRRGAIVEASAWIGTRATIAPDARIGVAAWIGTEAKIEATTHVPAGRDVPAGVTIDRETAAHWPEPSAGLHGYTAKSLHNAIEQQARGIDIN